MKKAVGRVVVRGTDVGIPNLLVAAYDASLGSTSPTHTAPSVQDRDESCWNRWGSVITDHRGAFSIVNEHDGQSGNLNRLIDIVLVVSVPEPGGMPGDQTHTRITTCVRHNPGDLESFLIAV